MPPRTCSLRVETGTVARQLPFRKGNAIFLICSRSICSRGFHEFHSLFGWNVTARPDCMAMALSAGGFLLFYSTVLQPPLSGEEPDEKSVSPAFIKGSMVRLALSGLLMLCAFYTKQSMIAVPFSCLIYLLLTGRYRHAAIFFASTILLGLSVFLSLRFLFSSHFHQNVILSLRTPAVVKNPCSLFLALSPPEKIILVLGIVCSATLLAKRKHSLFALTALVALGSALLSMIRCGSNVNYFIEPLFYIDCLSSLWIVHLARKSGRLVFLTLLAGFMIWHRLSYLDTSGKHPLRTGQAGHWRAPSPGGTLLEYGEPALARSVRLPLFRQTARAFRCVSSDHPRDIRLMEPR